MYLTKAMEDYLRHSQDELKALIRDLCAIPAPSHQEDARAAYVRDWLEQAGGRPEIDEAKNVICPLGDDDGDVVVFMAHTDTVFPDLAPMPFREEAANTFAPASATTRPTWRCFCSAQGIFSKIICKPSPSWSLWPIPARRAWEI